MGDHRAHDPLTSEELRVQSAFNSAGGEWGEKDEDVRVSYFQSPNELYIQREGASRALQLLQDYLCNKIRDHPRQPSNIVHNGIYLYPKNQNGKKLYYRIRLQREKSNSFSGTFMDTGESPIPVQSKDLLFCVHFVRILTPLAFRASLFGISLSKGKWEECLYAALRGFFTSPSLGLSAKLVGLDSGALSLILMDQLGSINEVFAHSGDPHLSKISTVSISYDQFKYKPLRKGSRVRGKVLNMGLGLHFYFVSEEDMSKYENVLARIQELYKSPVNMKAPFDSPGQVVVARQNSTWSRCLIQNEDSGGFELFDIDSGNCLKNVRDIYQLYEELENLPLYLHYCNLLGYNSNDPNDCFLGRTLINFESTVELLVKSEGAIASVEIYPE
eukprot:TRINITY_DN7733_c0_g1_i1.p1 TRINITY_DN7733_c0_g1~~TRINITY_DN7733_c0_g1_i1.p1  ORF type:complete len:387 (-),score=65.13 TRINITY_DN7733_c0_g1_i1:325-1485(-)